MDSDEKARMNSLTEEILQFIENEPLVKLEKLDLNEWQKAGGFSDKLIKDLLDKESKMRQKTAHK